MNASKESFLFLEVPPFPDVLEVPDVHQSPETSVIPSQNASPKTGANHSEVRKDKVEKEKKRKKNQEERRTGLFDTNGSLDKKRSSKISVAEQNVVKILKESPDSNNKIQCMRKGKKQGRPQRELTNMEDEEHSGLGGMGQTERKDKKDKKAVKDKKDFKNIKDIKEKKNKKDNEDRKDKDKDKKEKEALEGTLLVSNGEKRKQLGVAMEGREETHRSKKAKKVIVGEVENGQGDAITQVRKDVKKVNHRNFKNSGEVKLLDTEEHSKPGGESVIVKKKKKKQNERKPEKLESTFLGGAEDIVSVDMLSKESPDNVVYKPFDSKEAQNSVDMKVNEQLAYEEPPRKAKSSSLLDKMRSRLQGGQFRMLNEKLYTCRGQEALQFFSKDPKAFFQYHKGYREQTAQWPRLPVDVIADWLNSRSKAFVVADFGCGDATLAAKVPNKVFSLDLVSSNPSVITCNMAHTPLEKGSVDVAVFCLSLMGIDYHTYLFEAYRVLKQKGFLVIAEVKSRFDPSNGGADQGEFINALAKLGFRLQTLDTANKMFLLLFLQKGKVGEPISKKKLASIDWPTLKACIYKRR